MGETIYLWVTLDDLDCKVNITSLTRSFVLHSGSNDLWPWMTLCLKLLTSTLFKLFKSVVDSQVFSSLSCGRGQLIMTLNWPSSDLEWPWTLNIIIIQISLSDVDLYGFDWALEMRNTHVLLPGLAVWRDQYHLCGPWDLIWVFFCITWFWFV